MRKISNIRCRSPRSRTRRISPIATVLLATAALGTSALGGVATSSASTRTSHIKVYNLTIDSGILAESETGLYAAIQDGFFVKNGLNVTNTLISDTNAQVSTAEAGNPPIAIGGMTSLAAADVAGAKLVGFANLGNVDLEMCMSTSFAAAHGLKLGSPLSQVAASLKGQNVGVSNVNTPQDLTTKFFEKTYGGLNPATDVNTIALGSQAALVTALETGRIAAVEFNPPVCETIQALGKAVVVSRPAAVPAFRGTPDIIALTSTSYAKTHKALLKAFSKSLAEANKYVDSHPAAADAVLQKIFPATAPSIVAETWSAVSRFTIPKTAAFTRAGWKAVSKIMLPVTGINLNTKEGILWTNKYLPGGS